ncbi:GIY-YIG nuclease family protein [Sporosalibacterium faouarense]|uniref:GIY-YIG nuclease family protein n=1 Tax=Sporosalibacterium faouarense TaxID=516123 RepID=UPI00192ACE2D|nr:GIY-YIG nuclease family protein [Sporosalibacterium faouarense]
MDIDLIKHKVQTLIKVNHNEVTNKSKYNKISGIYMIYIDDFTDKHIVPIYIGQTSDIQRRYKDHLKELMALNRLTKKFYTAYLEDLFYEGRYKSCKVFKYMVEHNCSLNDFHMIMLEECDKNSLLDKETEHISEFKTEFVGFNQLSSVTSLLSKDYEKMTNEDKNNLSVAELKEIKKYIKDGYCKFNYFYCYGLISKKVRDIRIEELRKDIYYSFHGADENKKYDVEYNNVLNNPDLYWDKRLAERKSAVIKYLTPYEDYVDFPLRNLSCDIHFPRLKKNECGVYFVISNMNRFYNDYQYSAEIVKIVVLYTDDEKNIYQEYYIKNQAINQMYFEKDYKRMYCFRPEQFQITHNSNDLHLITLTTELKTGVNDYEFEKNQLWDLKEAIDNIINNVNLNMSFRMESNQSKKVMEWCLSNVSYIQRQILYNKMEKRISFEDKKILFVHNDMFTQKYYKERFKKEGIKTRRSNDYTRGVRLASKGTYDCIIFKIKRNNDPAISAIKNLREINSNILIIAYDNRHYKSDKNILEVDNVFILKSSIPKIEELLEILLKHFS